VRNKRAISADTALRLGRYFNNSPQFWLNLQSHYDLELESEELEKVLKYEIKPLQLEVLKICDGPRT